MDAILRLMTFFMLPPPFRLFDQLSRFHLFDIQRQIGRLFLLNPLQKLQKALLFFFLIV